MANACSTFSNRLRTISRHPSVAPHYLLWLGSGIRSKLLLSRRVLRIDGFKLTGFRTFSNYLGAWRNRPTQDEIEFIRSSIPRGGIAFDVGANFGIMSIFMSRAARDGQVHAFEPNPLTRVALSLNMEINGCKNVTCVQAAVGEATGSIGFTDTADPGTNRIEVGAPLKVEMVSLDDYIFSNGIDCVDFLKIDIEGAEAQALRGVSRSMSSMIIRRGMIEICPGTLSRFGTSASELFDLFDCAGYEMFWLETPDAPLRRSDVEELDPCLLTNAGFRASG